MRRPSRRARRVAIAGALILLAIFTVRGATRAQAIDIVTRTAVLSPISLGADQTVALFASSYEGPDTKPVDIELMFVDVSGSVLKQQRSSLRPGETAFLHFDQSELRSPQLLILTRAVVRVIGDPNVHPPVVSEEILDSATSKVLFLHPGVSKGFDPQPDPPGMPVIR